MGYSHENDYEQILASVRVLNHGVSSIPIDDDDHHHHDYEPSATAVSFNPDEETTASPIQVNEKSMSVQIKKLAEARKTGQISQEGFNAAIDSFGEKPSSV